MNPADFKIELINSPILRQIISELLQKGVKISFYGKAWANIPANWVYVDHKIDIDYFQKKYSLPQSISIHTNEDPKSGREKGFVDEITKEGIMGLY